MWMWFGLWACNGAEAPLRSEPIAPTRDLSTPSIVVPADSPLAPFVSAGAPAWPTGMLGHLAPGLPEDEVRRVVEAIRDPRRPPEDVVPATGVVAVPGKLLGFERVGFVATVRDGGLVSLDVSAPPPDWEGVLETAWGPGTEGALHNGLPTTTWTNSDLGLVVTRVRGRDGLVVVQWTASRGAPQPSIVPSPADASH